MTKLGVHFQGPPENADNHPDTVTEIIQASSIKFIKGIDPDHWPSVSFPNQTIIGRFWIGGDGTEMEYVREGAHGAEKYFEILRPRYEKVPWVRIIEGPNETQVWACDWKAASDFQVRLGELVHELGREYAAWSFSVFWPKIRDVARLQPSLQVADYLELHDYWIPFSPFSGHPRAVIAELQRLGIHNTKVIIGECGVDGLVINHPNRRGWKDFAGWGYTREMFWQDMSNYDDMQPPEVVAITPFVTCPNKDWASFDIDGNMVARMAAKWEQGADPWAVIIQEAQEHIIPLNPGAAFEKWVDNTYLPASKEFDVLIGGVMWRAQAYRRADKRDQQMIVRCPVNNWDKIEWLEIDN